MLEAVIFGPLLATPTVVWVAAGITMYGAFRAVAAAPAGRRGRGRFLCYINGVPVSEEQLDSRL